MKHIYLIGLKFIHKLLFILVYLRINNNNKKNSVEIINILKFKKYKEKEENSIIKDISEKLRKQTFLKFKNQFSQHNIKILIHIPNEFSMGGQSVFQNWSDGLKFQGVKTEYIPWNRQFNSIIDRFKPDVIITSDHSLYLDQFDWDYIKSFREKHKLLLIFTASHEKEGNSSNQLRLENAKLKNVDFFISFQNEDFIRTNYSDWEKYGYDILSVPFSGNPLIYQYTEIENYYDFSFLGSSNPEKVFRYYKYFSKIFQKYNGIIFGPGWNLTNYKILDRKYHKYFYNMASIGLNLHIPSQISNNSEINERTYSLACNGTFQIIDNPKAINILFPEVNKVVTSDSPKEYIDKFEYYLNNPSERIPYTLYSLEQIYNQNTIFHRMDKFVNYLLNYLK